MSDDTIKVGAEVDIAALKSGMNAASQSVEDFTARSRAALATFQDASKQSAEAQRLLDDAFDKASASGATFVEALEAANAAYAETGVAAKAAAAATDEFAAAQKRSALVARDSSMLLGRELGGGIGYQLGRIAAQSKALAPLIGAAFPIIGAAALVDVLAQVGEELYKAYQNATQAGEAIAAAFSVADDRITATTNDIQLQNSKLQDEIDKLEGHPSNGLQTALLEARDAADKLQQSLDADNNSLTALLKKHEVGWLGALVTGFRTVRTSGIDAQIETQSTKIDEQARKITEQFDLAVANSGGDKHKFQAAQKAYFDGISGLYDRAVAELQPKLQKYYGLQKQNQEMVAALRKASSSEGVERVNSAAAVIDYSPAIATLEGQINRFRELGAQAKAAISSESLEQQKGNAEQAKAQAEDAKRNAAAAREAARQAAETQMQAFNEGFAQLKATHQLSTEQEIAYWESMAKIAGQGSANYAKVLEKLAALRQQLNKETAAFAETGASLTSPDALSLAPRSSSTDYMKSIEDAANANTEWVRSLVQARQIQIQTTDSLAEASIRSQELAGKLTTLGADHATAALHAKEYNEQLAILQQKLVAIAQTPMSPEERRAQTQGVNNQIAQLQGGNQVQQVTDQDKMLADLRMKYQSFFDSIDSGFNRALDGWLQGTETFGMSMRRAWDSIGLSVTNQLLKIGEKKLASELASRAAHVATTQANVATDAAGAAESESISKASAMKQALHFAGLAAIKAYSSVADVPIIGPVLGAAAAAATFAGAMAFEAFERGGIVAGDLRSAVPIMAHAGERVLTTSQTNVFERLVSSPQSGQPSGSPHFHYSPQISAIDGASVEGMTRQHGQTFMREGMRQLRRMNLVQ